MSRHLVTIGETAPGRINTDRRNATNTMKTTLILAIAILLSVTGFAQNRYVLQSLSVPSVIAASSTTNVALTLDVRKATEVTIQLNFKMMGAGTDSITCVLEKSVDGSNWGTDAYSKTSWICAATGTTAARYATNITMGGAGYLRLYSVQNGVAEIMTNVSAYYSLKQPTS